MERWWEGIDRRKLELYKCCGMPEQQTCLIGYWFVIVTIDLFWLSVIIQTWHTHTPHAQHTHTTHTSHTHTPHTHTHRHTPRTHTTHTHHTHTHTALLLCRWGFLCKIWFINPFCKKFTAFYGVKIVYVYLCVHAALFHILLPCDTIMDPWNVSFCIYVC